MYLIEVIPAARLVLPSSQILTYFTSHKLKAGSLVLAPVGKKNTIAVVTAIKNAKDHKMAIRRADFALRAISDVISKEPILDEKQLALAKWISEYYWAPLGTVIKMALPPHPSLQKTPQQKNSPEKPKQRRRSLSLMEASAHSSKTKQTLILAPEISTAQTQIKQRDSASTAILHSELTNKQRLANWQKIKTGQAKTIIGTRAALLAPFVNLERIILEHEHNPNYKSQKTPRLHARDTAIKLAELWNIKLICKSPTPSVEAQWLASSKKITLASPLAQLKQDVAKKQRGARTPTAIISLRQELKQGNFSIFSRQLQEKIKTALTDKKQIILFINRRGSSTVLLCRDCAHIPKCPNCEAPLVYHLSPVKFICHHCGHTEAPPGLCPHCRGSRIKFLGTGAQKVEAEFRQLFPKVSTARLDSDTVKAFSQYSKSPNFNTEKKPNIPSVSQIINNFHKKKIQVLITTQIILNKNLKPAQLTAVINADTLLHLPDFRSNERTLQILNQLKNLSSEAFIIQTYLPNNTAIQAIAQDNLQNFYKKELQARKTLSYPPFIQLIILSFHHQSNLQAKNEAEILMEKLHRQIYQLSKLSSKHLPISLIGPTPAFRIKIRKKYIWQIIIKTALSDLKMRNKFLEIIPPSWTIDVDPLQTI